MLSKKLSEKRNGLFLAIVFVLVAMATAAIAAPWSTGFGLFASSSVAASDGEAPFVVLYSQNNNPGTVSTGSQDFEAANNAFDDFCADDFVVPAGQTWNISEVDATGVYFNGPGPAASFNVFIYQNAGTLPGTQIYSATGQTYVNATGVFQITLASPAVLTAGTYWISVQARQDFTPAGQWGWTNRTVQANSPAAWQNPGGGFAACPAWGIRSVCTTSPAGENDQMFQLQGTIGGGASPTPSPAATPSPTPCTGNYTTSTMTGQTITAGTVDSGNHCDDCATAITFPFPVSVYGQTFNSANVASNGALDLIGTQAPFTHGCQVLPNALWTMAILPYQDDLRTDNGFTGCAGFPGGNCGIFTSTTGTAPNRKFNVEWRAVHFADTTTSVNFEVVFSEGQSSFFDVVYGATSDSGLDETSGVQASATGPATTFSCGTATLTNGLKVTYTLGTCASPSPSPGVSPSPTCNPAWQNEPPMTAIRRNPVTAAVGSNLYAITGFDLNPNYTTINERFNGTSWTTMAPIPVRHAQGRGAVVGTNIYVPGGFNSVDFGGPLDTMQIYDTVANTWFQGTVLPAARSGVATAAFNGLVYVIGGYNPVGTGHNEVYIYNPGTNSYTTGAPMTATAGNAPGVLFNGEIYVVGGGTSPGAQFAYNPVTNVWRTIAALPTTGGQCQSGNGFVLDNEIWIVGCLGLAINQQVWIYNSGTNAWRAGPAYNVDHQGPGATLFNGRGFVVGGGTASGGSTAVESIGPCGPVATPSPTRTPTPTPVASPTPTRTPTPTPVVSPSPGCTPIPGTWTQAAPVTVDHYGGFMSSDGTFAYEGGGYSFSAGGNINQFGKFNPATNTWTPLAPVPDLTNGLASGVYAPNVNKLFVFGGEDNNTATVVNTTRIYDIATNTWSTGAVMPDVRAFMGSGYFNGKIYLVGGYTTGNVDPSFGQVWEYDPVLNTWNTTRMSMPATLGGPGFGVINGHIYIAGGRNLANTNLNTLYDYDIAANTWTARANMPTGVNVPGSAVIGGKLWVFGGGNPFVEGRPDTPDTTNILQIYDPATNTWSSGPTLNQQRSFPVGTNVGNTAVAVGGYTGSTTTTSVEINIAGGACSSPTPGITPTPTRTPTPTPVASPSASPCTGNYTFASSTGATIVAGTTDTGNHVDDGTTTIALPFSVTLYDQTFSSVNLSSNGNAQFVSNSTSLANACPLPTATFNYAIMPHWDDLRTDQVGTGCTTYGGVGCGIFTIVTGTAPNRVFNIEWRTVYFGANTTRANFELKLYEGQSRFDVIYGEVAQGGSSATVGVQRDTGSLFSQYECNTAGSLSSGQQLVATLGTCGTPSPSPTVAASPTPSASPACSPGAPGPWTVAAPYPITDVRYGFAQTATHFYVFGGVSNGTRVGDVNRMDIATGTWQSRAPMPFMSEAPTCALMASTGIVYCAEGDTGSNFASYNTATNAWTPLAAIPGGDHYGSASGAFNGKVFVAGGTTAQVNTVQVYDVASNTWSTGTAAPVPFLLAGYQQVGQFLYVVGGFNPGGPNVLGSMVSNGPQDQPDVPEANNATTSRLDMSSAPGVWSAGPAFTQGRADFGLAYDAAANKLYALGGDTTGGGFFDSTNLVDELSVASWPAGTWTASPPNLILPNRQANQAGFYGGGQIWSVGGLVGSTFQFLAEVQRRTNGICAGATPTPTPPVTPSPTRTPTPTPTPSASPGCTPGPPSAWTTAAPYPITDVRYGFAQTATHFYVFGGVSNGTRVGDVNRMDIATGTWQSRAPMPFMSEAPTCALMASTGIVYCAEGDTGSNFASYNTATNAWTPLAAIPGGDHYGSASGAFNGKVFVAGGTTAQVNTVQVYDVASNTWSTGTAAPVPFLLAGYQQVGQFLYVVGGFNPGGPNALGSMVSNGPQDQPDVPEANNATTSRLDMSSAPGVWSAGPAFTQGRADFGLAYDAAANKLYALGGDTTGGGFFDSTNLVDELSVASWPAGTWTASPPNLILPNRQANQAGFYGGGQIWSVGGLVGSTFQFLAEVQRRTNGICAGATPTPTPPVTPSPTRTPTPTPVASPSCSPSGWTQGPAQPPARALFQGALGTDNKLYIAGGQNLNGTVVNAEVARYNATTNAWESVAPLPVGTGQVTVGAANGKVFVAGGFILPSAVTNALRIYDIASNTWSSGANMPAAKEAAAGAVVNGKFYVMGGDDGTNGVNTNYIYDIATNTWSTGAVLPDSRTNTYATAAGGMVYVFGGGIITGTTTTAVDTLLRYDPVANSWTNLGSAGTAGLGNYGGVSPFAGGTQLLITSGSTGAFVPGNTTRIFTIAGGTFSAGPNLLANRSGHAQGTLTDGRVLVADGFDTATTMVSTVELLGGGGTCPTPTPVVTPTPTPTPVVTPTTTPGTTTMQFSMAAFPGDESQNEPVTITRTGIVTATSSVNFSATSGTATGGTACTSGVDFLTVLNQPVQFNPNETSKTVFVTLCPDTLMEGFETINLTLSMPVGGTLGTPNVAVMNLNDTANQFRSVTEIDFNLGGPASPYPSTILVANGPIQIDAMRVTLYDVTHQFPDNMDLLLVGPTGIKYIFMADAGGPTALVSPVTLTFSDSAATAIPNNGPLVTGSFKPVSWEAPQSNFAAPAPPAPYIEPNSTGVPTLASAFRFTNSNGTWSLYARDDNGAFDPNVISGMIAGGWGLEFLQSTAAGVSLSGRVMTAEGAGIRNARVTIAGSSLPEPRVVTTGSFGYFSFEGLAAGETYVVTVNSQRYTFTVPSRVITLVDNLTDVDFTADPNE